MTACHLGKRHASITDHGPLTGMARAPLSGVKLDRRRRGCFVVGPLLLAIYLDLQFSKKKLIGCLSSPFDVSHLLPNISSLLHIIIARMSSFGSPLRSVRILRRFFVLTMLGTLVCFAMITWPSIIPLGRKMTRAEFESLEKQCEILLSNQTVRTKFSSPVPPHPRNGFKKTTLSGIQMPKIMYGTGA